MKTNATVATLIYCNMILDIYTTIHRHSIDVGVTCLIIWFPSPCVIHESSQFFIIINCNYFVSVLTLRSQGTRRRPSTGDDCRLRVWLTRTAPFNLLISLARDAAAGDVRSSSRALSALSVDAARRCNGETSASEKRFGCSDDVTVTASTVDDVSIGIVGLFEVLTSPRGEMTESITVNVARI